MLNTTGGSSGGGCITRSGKTVPFRRKMSGAGALLAAAAAAIVFAPAARHNHNHNQRQQRSLVLATEAVAYRPEVSTEQQQQLQLHHQNGTHNLGCPSQSWTAKQSPQQQQRQMQAPASSYGFVQSQVSSFVRPMFYTLRLKVDPTKRKFTGQLMVTLDVLAPPPADEPGGGGGGGGGEPAQAGAELGYRYLTLHAGAHLQVSKAFYVYQTRGSVQIPATKLGKSARDELLTLDFHPNLITAGQGLLLLVYSGAVNETDSHGLFVHHSQKAPHHKPAHNSPRPPAPTTTMGPNSGDDTVGLATHMQPSFARRLLPCWDEPQLKARFSLVVVLPFRGYQTISNMPIRRKSISVSQCSGESMQEVEFHPTPTMSTYLLTLVVGRFEYLESVSANNCRVRVYVYATTNSTSTHLQQQQQQQQQRPPPVATIRNYRRSAAQMGLDCAVSSLERLEQLLAIRYPLAKLDLIGLREFNGGGMENWGASIFHENYLLYEQNATLAAELNAAGHHQQPQDIQVLGGRSRPRRLVVPLVVAHEVTHQWFGNLVTAASWTYLWLNEGFAQMLMYELADHLWPQHNYWLMFLEDSRLAALHEDELYSSSHALELHSMGANLSSEEQLSLFDQITYNKGAQVVRMLQCLLGSQRFYSGLRHYLHKHSYLAVTSHDLWLALEEANGLPEGRLGALMSGWLHNEGLPLLTVQAREEPHQWRLTIRQERFALLKGFELEQQQSLQEDGNATAAEPLWAVHVTLANLAPSDLLLFSPSSSHGGRKSTAGAGGGGASVSTVVGSSFLVKDRTSIVLLPKSALSPPNWFKLNANATGYFRVDYQTPAESESESAPGQVDLLERLVEPIREQQLNPVDRHNIVDDFFALVKAGRKRTAHYLAYLARAYSRELHPLVVRPIVESLRKIRALVSNDADHSQALPILLDLFAQHYLRNLSQALEEEQALVAGEGERRELADLLESSWVQFNESHFLKRASQVFAAKFRAQPAWDGMDREMRASILTGALLKAASLDQDLAPGASLPDRLYGPDVPPPPPPPPSPSPSADATSEPDTFMRLLRAYATSESGGERFALATALGTISEPQKQAKLLNLTLEEAYFRPQDATALLESMGRTRTGRQLLMASLQSHSKTIERRQLLGPLLRSLAQGLIEPAEQQQQHLSHLATPIPALTFTTTAGTDRSPLPSEGQGEEKVLATLRRLFQESNLDNKGYVNVAIEQVLINTHWFKRDRQHLLDYLQSLHLRPIPASSTGVPIVGQ